MTPYTFYLRDGVRAVPTFEIELFDRDEDALRHADRLLRERTRYSVVEVTAGDRRVAEVDRRVAQP